MIVSLIVLKLNHNVTNGQTDTMINITALSGADTWKRGYIALL